jgi:hypothetical protein
MKTYLFTDNNCEQPIITGYVAAVTIIFISFAIIFFDLEKLQLFGLKFQINELLLIMLALTFSLMTITDFWAKNKIAGNFQAKRKGYKKQLFSLLVSSFYRFLSLLFVFYLMTFTINNHYYYSSKSFEATKFFFSIFLQLYVNGTEIRG